MEKIFFSLSICRSLFFSLSNNIFISVLNLDNGLVFRYTDSLFRCDGLYKIVHRYNEILDRHKRIVDRYNGSVDRYNGLASRYNG